MKINILGHDYNIEPEEGMFFHTGNYGKHSYSRLEIDYDPDMKPTVKGEAILHEIFEAINHWTNLGLDHHQITLLSVGLYSVLQNNAYLTGFLLDGEQETKKC